MPSKPDRARVLEFTSYFQVLEPDEEALTLWINTMMSGDYRFGYGLLRSADDDYDPFGVLAALQGGDWTWDAQDEAWAFKGSATTLNPFEFARWMGMKSNYEWVQKFLDAATTLADQCVDFESFCAVLRAAFDNAGAGRQRLNEASHAAFSRLDGPNRTIDADSLRVRNYSRAPFNAFDGVA